MLNIPLIRKHPKLIKPQNQLKVIITEIKITIAQIIIIAPESIPFDLETKEKINAAIVGISEIESQKDDPLPLPAAELIPAQTLVQSTPGIPKTKPMIPKIIGTFEVFFSFN